MKNIVIIVGSYYPRYSAVGICAQFLANALKAYDVNLIVLCQKNEYFEEEEIEVDNVRIIRLSTRLNDFKLRQKRKSFLLFQIVRIVRYLQAFLQRVNIKYDWVNAYYSKLLQIRKDLDINVIIPCSFPFASILAASRYKQNYPDVKIIPFIFDNFVENPDLHRLKINKQLKWNKHINLVYTELSNCDRVLCLHTLKPHFDKFYPNSLKRIIQYVEHPLLVPYVNNNIVKDESRINITYAGGFMKGYVEPFHMLEIMSSVLKRRDDIDIHLFTNGNRNNFIDEFASRNPNIYFHGFVPYNEATEAVSKSDFLICVAENSGIQMSSKIFQYISLGKPIILFYTSDNDCNLTFLKKYPGLFSIKKDDRAFDIDKFIEFIDVYRSWSISFDQVKTLYSEALPSTVAKLVMSIVDEE